MNGFVIGDAHMPYMNKTAFTKILAILEQEGPSVDYVIQMGDLYDMFSQGRWARTFDLITPKQEMIEARMMAEEFWRAIRKRAPKAQCYQLIGNHDERPIKKVIEKAPELASLLDIKHLWQFPGVTTMASEREELIIDDILFMHGYRSKLGDHARYNQMNTVCGHSHRGGVVYFPVKGKVIWELNAGYLGDESQVPLQYGKQARTNWTMGFAMIDQLGPRFCPL